MALTVLHVDLTVLYAALTVLHVAWTVLLVCRGASVLEAKLLIVHFRLGAHLEHHFLEEHRLECLPG